MEANTFRLLESTAELKKRERIKTFCTMTDNVWEPFEKFKTDNLEEALEMLKKDECKPSAFHNGKFWIVTEYMVEASEYDKEGDFVCGCDYYPACDFEWSWDLEGIEIKHEE